MLSRLLYFFWIVMSCCCIGSMAAELPDRTFRAGCENEYLPYCFVSENGPDGFSVDLMREVTERMGLKVEFVPGSWGDLKKKLKLGEIEALPLMAKTLGREKSFDFTFPYLTMHGVIIVRSGSSGVQKLSDLKGKRVAVIRGGSMEELLRKADVGALITPTSGSEQPLRMLQNGEQDAVVMQQLTFAHLVARHNIAGVEAVKGTHVGLQQHYCMAVAKGNHKLLATLNEGLALAIADGTFRKLQQRWFAELGSLYKKNQVLIVGGDWNYPPYEFIDTNGEPAGFNVELTMAIARKMGMQVVVKLNDWGKTRKNLLAHKIDAVEGMFYSAERAREFLFSPPHSILNHVAVVRADRKIPETISDYLKLSIVVMDGDIMHDWAVKNGLENRLTVVGSQEDALRLVSRGEYDCALVAQIPAYYWIAHYRLEGLNVGTTPLLSPEYCYAVSSDNVMLMSRFTEGLTALKETGEYRSIRDKWLAPYEKNEGLWLTVKTAALILAPLLALVFVLLLWGYTLRCRVRAASKKIIDSEARWRYAIEEAGDGLWELNLQTGSIYFSQRFKDMLGYVPDDLTYNGLDWESHIHPDDLTTTMESYHKYLSGETKEFSCTFRMKCKEGSYKWLMSRGKIIEREASGKALRFIGTYTDITDLISTREALKQSQKRIEIAASVAGFGVWEHNLETGGIVFDDKINEIYGLNEESRNVKIEEWVECLHPDDREQVLQAYQKAIDSRDCFRKEFRIIRSDGEVRYIQGVSQLVYDNTNRPTRMVGINSDITESHTMELKIRQMEKMNSLGQLAGGIAHDFNNQLAGIMGFSELLMSKNCTEQEHSYLEGILSGVRHLSGLTRQLLAFARKGQYRVEQIHMNTLIVDLTEMLKRSFDKRITFETLFGASDDVISGDPSQIQNALLNIALNSRDAMCDGGTICFRASNVEMDYDTAHSMSDSLQGGTYYKLEISDTGLGFDDETAKHIFEPFYTTKELGKGTGMGLPAVLGTVQNHYGHITVDSCYGKGTTVSLYFPVIHDADLVDILVDGNGFICGKRFIYINSDSYVKGIATHEHAHWCNTKTHKQSEDILNLYRSEYLKIDFIIIDLDMPDNIGLQVFKAIMEINPDANVIITAGESSQYSEQLLKNGACRFLNKPLLKSDIKKVIGAVSLKTRNPLADVVMADDGSGDVCKVLVVDDEKVVRDSLKITLELEGYDVITAPSGGDAVSLFKDNPSSFSLVLLDLIMPDMDGSQVFSMLREVADDIKVIIVSGYTSESLPEEITNSERVWFMQKPFDRQEIGQFVKEILKA